MITHVANVSLFVKDQQKSLSFYVDKLGFEKRTDQEMGPGAPRWIEVAPKGSKTVIVLYKPTPKAPGSSTYRRALSSIGTFAPFVLEVKDMEATCKELKAKGVKFADPPKKQYYGWWATIKDPDGNVIGMHG